MNTIRILTSIAASVILACLINASAQAQSTNIYNYQVLNLQVNDLIYSSPNRLIYASVPSTGGQYGNHIIAINPFTKQITGSVFAGSEPNKLAVAGDGSFLYVGLDGAASIRRIRLDTFVADISFGLGSGSFGLHFPEDIVVLPNQPTSVAVSRRNSCCSPRHEGVAVYDNGVMRSQTTPGHTGSNVIEPGDSGAVLYGYNNETTDFGFRRMAIGQSGVSVTSVLQNAIAGFGVDIRFSNGYIYSSTGRIIDPVSNTLHGTFAVQGSSNGFVPDGRAKRVFYLSGNSLQAFNSSNFQPAGVLSLANSGHSAARLIRWGRRGFAFRTGDGRVVLFESSIVPAQPNINDFSGDEISDYAVFRPSDRLWYANGGPYGVNFGESTDIPVAADYDGDNKTDIAMFRGGTWYVLGSSNNSFSVVQFGLSSDRPIPSDFDGDQKTDISVYRDGLWYILRSSNGQVEVANFGVASDRPVRSDFDGDGRTDVAVYRPSSGDWYILQSTNNQVRVEHLGNETGTPIPADYDGDGRSDIAILQSNGFETIYYVLRSSDGMVNYYLVAPRDSSIPQPMDVDGDGSVDPTTFRNGVWTTQRSSTGTVTLFNFGTAGDKPVY